MSSPSRDPTNTIPQGRKIAPLPRRARNSLPRSSQSAPSSDGTPSPSRSSGVIGTSHLRDSYQSLDTSLSALRLSPQTPATPAKSNSLPTNTLRLLHNATPRRSIEREEVPLLASHRSPAERNYSSLPEVVTPDHHIPQSLHTLYSDEKIAIPGGSSPLERGIPMIVEDHAIATVATPHAPPIRPLNLLLHNQGSGSSSSLSARHERSFSDVSDISEISDNNGYNDITSSYDVGCEEGPEEAFYTSTFQGALQNGLEIADKVVSAIEKLVGSSEPSSDLTRLFNDARKLGTFHSTDTRTIAVLGDSGEGKSSLINALLHFPEIAKTGDIGSACTSVVTEYRQKTIDHTAPITIEVEYLSHSEIADLIKELLWNYRQIFLPEVEEDKVDSKDYARYLRESEQAWSALEAGFRHQRGFNKYLLSDMTEGALETATSQLIQWAHELEWPNGSDSGTWKATADTADECCEKTSVFMQDRFWPFTKIIRVYLSAQVLNTGVVLADLPGLQDTNLARVRATQTYLMKCDNVFIVAKLSRAITDQSLKSSLYSVLARHAAVEWEESGAKSLNLAIVCTKSEDINQKTARREFCGPHKRISSLVMEQLDKEIEDAKANKNKVLKKQLKRRQESLLIDARNSHVKQGLQDAYASKVPGGHLEVFCVSNTTYEKYSRKGNTEMVRASGIPELRRFCHTITAGAQLLEAKHFLQSTLSSLLSSVEIWASSPPPQLQIEDREHESIHDILQEVTTKLSKKIDQLNAEFMDTFREVLSDYLEQRNHFWEAAAGEQGVEWTFWHWTQYNAWCLNNGNHGTLRLGHVNWNSQLIWKMRVELEYQWGLVEDEIPIVFDTLLESIKTCLLDLQSHLRVQGFSQTLIQGIEFRVQHIEYKFRLTQQDFTRGVKLVQRHASEPNDTSYVVSEMVPAYRSAAGEAGNGKAARQQAIVQGRITNGTLFPHISAKIQADIEKLVQKNFIDLHDEVNIVLGLILSDVEMALTSRSEHVDDRADQGDPEEERRKEELLAEIMVLNKEHEEILVSILDMA